MGGPTANHDLTAVMVFVTASDEAEATRIGGALLDERLAACVNTAPVDSRYWWQGRVEEAQEVLLIIKTARRLLPAVIDRVRALHSYSVPEVVAVPVVGGNPAYLDWIEESVRSQ